MNHPSMHADPRSSGAGTPAPLLETSPALRILVVEDDPIARTLLQTWLKVDVGQSLVTAANGEEALRLARRYLPQVIITDWRMPVMDGIAFCKALRQTDWGNSIYVLMLTASSGDEDLVQAFDAGVDDFLGKPLNRQALGARLRAAWRYVHFRESWMRDRQRLEQANERLELSVRQLQLSSLSDALTGLPNRRAGQKAIVQALGWAQRHGLHMCVLCLSIDDLQGFSAVAGQEGCDEVLQSVGVTLQQAARDEDTVCRWGTDEFLIVAPGLSLSEGLAAARRFRTLIAHHRMALEGDTVGATVSVGVACWQSQEVGRAQLLMEVHRALLAAKRAGGDRVACLEGGQVLID